MDAVRVRIPVGETDGEGQYIEAEIEPGPGISLASRGGKLEETSWSLAEAFDRVGPALEVILGKLRSQLRAPKEIEVEFGLTLGGEFGVIFTKGTAEASFTVRAKWDDGTP
ncbi:CU044_2847 family protein [Acrocarpospora sp. B8E8]|uniref:CU044_2847 family protein n=1 Tax=Acrocarpospora sp. B8E8 TaxID=3153572 RepID=UPI00325C8F7C